MLLKKQRAIIRRWFSKKMKNSKIVNSLANQSRFSKILKRKIFFSNELKKGLLASYYEAQNYQTYVNLDLFLYGLISDPRSLSSRLILLTYSQFLNNKSLTSKTITTRIQKINQQNYREKKNSNISSEFSTGLFTENQNTPWLSPEVKEILTAAVKSALETKKQIVVVKSSHILFPLLAKEPIREFLRNLLN